MPNPFSGSALYRRLLRAGAKLPAPVARKVKHNVREAFELHREATCVQQQVLDAEAAIRTLQWLQQLPKEQADKLFEQFRRCKPS